MSSGKKNGLRALYACMGEGREKRVLLEEVLPLSSGERWIRIEQLVDGL